MKHEAKIIAVIIAIMLLVALALKFITAIDPVNVFLVILFFAGIGVTTIILHIFEYYKLFEYKE